MSDFSSTIEEKTRFIVKNPDGSFFHCIKIKKILIKKF